MPRNSRMRTYPPRPGLLARLRRAIGETSVLRGLVAVPVGEWVPYSLDSSRVNYDLARALYRNTDDRYKLGAAFARPIINSTAGFVGVPHFSHPDPEADQALEDFASRWSSRLLRAVRNALRDGDCFVRLAYTQDPLGGVRRIEPVLLPPEWVTPVPDPLNGGLQQVIIRYPFARYGPDGRQVDTYTVTEVWTRTSRTITADSRAPLEVREALARESQENPWGLIPIVHLRNEPEEYALFGSSDLEPVEPFLRVYHDVMLYAAQGAKMFARPKVRFSLKDVDKFLERNFTPEELQSGRLQFGNKEIFLMEEGEDVSFITADSGLAAITTLLKFVFFCIVDVSETPEFAFGTAVQSSKASVSEQMVPFARKIRRKRGQFEEPFIELASMALYMMDRVQGPGRRRDSYQVDIGWEEVSPRDDKALAETVNQLVSGLVSAVEAGLMSMDAAAEFLREFVPSMLPWTDPDGDDDERRRVVRSVLLRQRLEVGQGLEPEPGVDDLEA